MSSEFDGDKELVAFQDEIKRLIDEWKLEFETRDGDRKSDFEPQKQLSNFLESKVDWGNFMLVVKLDRSTVDKMNEFPEWFSLVEGDSKKDKTQDEYLLIVDGVLGGEGKKPNLAIAVSNSRSGIMLVPKEKGAGGLPFFPEEVIGIEIIRRNSTDVDEESGSLITTDSLPKVWLELDARGERMFVKDKSGRVIEVISGQSNPVLPTVLLNINHNIGEESEWSEEVRMSVVDFIALKPRLFDLEKGV